MPSMEMMRDYVSRKYQGSWPQKVSRMPDHQVVGIYFSMLKHEKVVKKQDPNGPRQLSMFDANYCKGD